MINTITAGRELDERIMTLLGLTMSQVLEAPRYSTDMNAAVELFNHFDCKELRTYDDDGTPIWCCRWVSEKTSLDGVDVFATMPALAVCKAFLASRGKMIWVSTKTSPAETLSDRHGWWKLYIQLDQNMPYKCFTPHNGRYVKLVRKWDKRKRYPLQKLILD